MADTDATDKYWLLKAEPDSRIVKGKDVKFSVDDFEAAPNKTSAWEGVRNYEARNLMKEMRSGEKALFYHSNCKNPGIAGFAEVAKEAYPDHTAWDSAHPYYDAKSKQDDPKWFMVDLTLVERAKHFVPLTLLKYIADLKDDTPPTEVEYIGENGVAAIKSMDLVTRGRLSVQRVTPAAWTAISQLAESGGWDALDMAPKKGKGKPAAKKAAAAAADGDEAAPAPTPRAPRAAKTKASAKVKPKRRKAKGSDDDSDEEDDDYEEDGWSEEEVISKTTSSRRKRKADDYQELPPARRRAKA
ncbi:Autophagy-related protein [Mycena kentingensis (nom. inval.)]|nr:Autophagy-related protein [Mycena kentingensis (nom. inval.)]